MPDTFYNDWEGPPCPHIVAFNIGGRGKVAMCGRLCGPNAVWDTGNRKTAEDCAACPYGVPGACCICGSHQDCLKVLSDYNQRVQLVCSECRASMAENGYLRLRPPNKGDLSIYPDINLTAVLTKKGKQLVAPQSSD